MKIQTRLTLMGASVGISTLVAVLVAVFWLSCQFRIAANNEVNLLISTDLDRITQGAYDLVRSQDESIQKSVASGLRVAQLCLAQDGGLSLSKQDVSWTASNQFTHVPSTFVLPQMMLGSKWLGKNDDVSRNEPLVDDVMRLTGVTTTIFEKMDSQGDLLRVATYVQAKNGKRAIGTFIPAVNPDGNPNPVVASIMAGRNYSGNAYVVNAWYVSTYMPLFDTSHHVIGALYAGMKQESVDSLRQSLQNIVVGSSGHVSVIAASGSSKGNYLISGGSGKDGDCVWDATDASGSKYIQLITKRAIAASPGSSVLVRYPVKQANSDATTWQLGRAIYYKPWDWLIIAQTNESDFASFGSELWSMQLRMLLILAIVGMIVGMAAHVTFGYYSSRLAKRINRMVAFAGRIARGETEAQLGESSAAAQLSNDSPDELIRLESAFRDAVTHVDGMVVAAERIADGDLSCDVIPRSEKDRLGVSFQRMTIHLRSLMSSLSSVSNIIARSSATLIRSSDASSESILKMTSATKEVAETSRESAIGSNDVAKNNSEQAVQVAEASSRLAELSLTTGVVTRDADTTMLAAREANDAAATGADVVRRTILGMENIRETVAGASNVIAELGSSSGQIGMIVETINHIAEQTNLLALNAAIEAARAGESGRGFAVVADEVRKLAARSSQATCDIEKLIKEVQQQTARAIDAMRSGTTGVAAGVSLARQAGDALASIQERNELVVDRVTDILAAAQQISAVTGQITQTVDNVSLLMERTSASSEQVSACSSEVASSILTVSTVAEQELLNADRVSDAAKELAEIVEQLESLVGQFKFEEEPQQETRLRMVV